MERPKLKIELEAIDKITELIGVVGLLLLVGLPTYFFGTLPDMIPSHYGANGDPDAFKGGETIWTLPIIGVIMYCGLFWLNKYPHLFNYPQQITKENAERLYTVGTRMIRTINALVTWVFVYITYSTIQTTLGNQDGLGVWFTPLLMIMMFGTTMFFLYKSMREKPRPTNESDNGL